jgi:hypothetical protein
LLKAYSEALPDSIYGYYWRARVNYALDTTMMVEPYATTLIQGYQKTLELAELDRIRFKSLGTTAAQFLAGYYNNVKSDKATALTYANRGLELDSSHSTLKYIKQVLEKPSPKQSNPRGNTPARSGNSKPAPNTAPKASAIKNAAIKN